VLFLVCIAVSATWARGTLLLRGASSLLLVVALSTASGRRWILWCGTALAAVAIASSWGSLYVAPGWLHPTSFVATAVFLLLAAGSVLAAVISDRIVSLDTVAGAIAVYLLFGICFAFCDLIILGADRGAYRLPAGTADTSDVLAALQTFLYYSFTTLTTLGYGEIHPLRPLAQLASSAEAVGGQLYIAVLVARLVTIYRGRGGDAPERDGPSRPGAPGADGEK
jgi:voltage-gated potassium channel